MMMSATATAGPMMDVDMDMGGSNKKIGGLPAELKQRLNRICHDFVESRTGTHPKKSTKYINVL